MPAGFPFDATSTVALFLLLLQRFNSRPLNEAYFKAKPMVLLVGGYSVGKTTFIRYLLGRDFPNGRIGPEPVTDRFMVVMDGPDTRTVPGHALVMQQDKPFADLQKLGSGFLNKFECAQVPCEFTRKVLLLHDTDFVLPAFASAHLLEKVDAAAYLVLGYNVDYDGRYTWYPCWLQAD